MGDITLSSSKKETLHRLLPRIVLGVTVVLVAVVFSLYLYAKSDSRVMLVVALITTLCASLLLLSVPFRLSAVLHRHPVRCFGAAMAAVCVIFTFALPPFCIPDEHRHYFASYWMSDCVMGLADFSGGEAFPMRACDEEFADPPGNVSLISGESYGWVSDNAQIFSSDEELVLFGDRTFSTAADPLQSRLGSTLGLTLGRLLNLGAVPTFYLGRLGAAAIFVLLAMWAIKIAPFGQRMLMAVCLLPITVSLAASYSYDSAIISLSLLTFACFLRAIYGEGMLRRGDVIPLLALAVLLPPCKVVYSAIFGCAFLVPSRRFSTTGRAWAFKIGVIALALLAFASSRFATIASLVEVGESGGLNYRGSESGYMYTLSDIVSNPIGTVLMFLRSFDVMGGRLWGETFGSNLGSLQGELTAPSWVYGSFFALTLAASVRSSDDNKTIPWGHALVMGIVGILAILAVWLFMYLDWTFTTETVIQGMQGRYALPLLPLFFIAIRNTSFAWNKRGSAISLVAAMGYLDVYYVLWVMATGLTL